MMPADGDVCVLLLCFVRFLGGEREADLWCPISTIPFSSVCVGGFEGLGVVAGAFFSLCVCFSWRFRCALSSAGDMRSFSSSIRSFVSCGVSVRRGQLSDFGLNFLRDCLCASSMAPSLSSPAFLFVRMSFIVGMATQVGWERWVASGFATYGWKGVVLAACDGAPSFEVFCHFCCSSFDVTRFFNFRRTFASFAIAVRFFLGALSQASASVGCTSLGLIGL